MQKTWGFSWRALLVFIINGMGLLIGTGGLLVVALACVAALTRSTPLSLQIKPLFSLLWIVGFICLLMAPAALLSLLRMLGKPVPNWRIPRPFRAASLGWIVWLLAVGVGFYVSSRQSQLAWLLLPPLELLGIGLPLWWWVEFGVRGLKRSTALRNWSLLGTALNTTPLAAFSLQMALFAVVLAGLAVWLSSQPELAGQIARIVQRLSNANLNMEAITRILRPLLVNPLMILLAGALLAVVVPLIEEMIKSLPVWGLARRDFTPAEGLAAGLICGAAFAVFESLTSLASSADGSWAVLIFGRLGTGLLHTATTGMIGWGLAEAWGSQRYLQLGLVYLLMTALHGLWNAFAVFMGAQLLLDAPAQGWLEVLLARMALVAPLALAVLLGVMFLILARANQLARRQPAAQIIV